jgi:hypothetical protein
MDSPRTEAITALQEVEQLTLTIETASQWLQLDAQSVQSLGDKAGKIMIKTLFDCIEQRMLSQQTLAPLITAARVELRPLLKHMGISMRTFMAIALVGEEKSWTGPKMAALFNAFVHIQSRKIREFLQSTSPDVN